MLPIGGIAGRRNCDPVADVEGGQKIQEKGPGRTGGHNNPRSRNSDAIIVLVVERNSLPELGNAKRLRVSEPAVVQSPREAGPRSPFWVPRARLADFQMQHVGGRRLPRWLAALSTSIA